jgi:UDP-glucose 4-epimerase
MTGSQKTIVTGGAGFIGSNLVDLLIRGGADVHVIDDFSTGQTRFLEGSPANVHRIDLTDEGVDFSEIFIGASTVYHLAANADVRFGMNDTRRDLQQNVLATMRVAEAAARAGVEEVVFSSTGAAYGDALEHPTPETAKFPVQTSLYGMSKAAAEGILSSFASNSIFRVTAFRFVSVLGTRYMHGHVIDFVRQLVKDPENLTVLGNGTQRKSYMHVDDCVRALTQVRAREPYEVFNLGVDDYCTVRNSVEWICGAMELAPAVHFGTEDRGWVGDNPFTWLDVSKARDRGWVAERGIQASVEATVEWLMQNKWALEVPDLRH